MYFERECLLISRIEVFGVSPAFVVSLYGEQFSVEDFCRGLSVAAGLGFGGYQPEVFVRDALADWVKGGARQVNEKARSLGLEATQFVAHFMHRYFSSPEMLLADSGVEELKQVIEIVKEFYGCQVLTIPVLPFQMGTGSCRVTEYQDIQNRLVEKINTYLELITDGGLVLAFEIVPFSVIGSVDRLVSIADELATDKLGVNLDTGHAWAGREIMEWIPFKLKGRIFGLHLKDNNSDTNLPLAPGKGTILWRPFLESLAASGYRGSLDIEIGCESEHVCREYLDSLNYLESLIDKMEWKKQWTHQLNVL